MYQTPQEEFFTTPEPDQNIAYRELDWDAPQDNGTEEERPDEFSEPHAV